MLIMVIWNPLEFDETIIFLCIFIYFRHLVVTSYVNIFSIIKCSVCQLRRWIGCIEIHIIGSICICYSWFNIYWITLPFLFSFLITCILVDLKLIWVLFIIIPGFQVHLVDLMGLIFNTRWFFIIILLNSLSINVRVNHIVWRCDIWTLFVNIWFTRLFSVCHHVLSVLWREYILCPVFVRWFCPMTYHCVFRLLLFKYIVRIFAFSLLFCKRLLLFIFIFYIFFIDYVRILKWRNLFFSLSIH